MSVDLDVFFSSGSMTAAITGRSHEPLSKRLVAFGMLLGCGEFAI